MSIQPQLSENLERRALALFLGADLLRAVTGLPSRAELARGLAERHGIESSTSLAQVAQRVSRAGNRFDFTDYLRRELDTAGQPVPAFYRNLAAFANAHTLPAIVTTAYDDFLERALRDASVPFDRLVRGSDVAFARADRLALIKLYGDVQMPDTLVVTEDDHDGLWRDRDKENLLDEVRGLLKRQTILFLGYNLSDPDFRLLWREVLDKMGRFARTAYAVWPGLPEEEQRVWRDRMIQVLEADPWGLVNGKKSQMLVNVAQDGQTTVSLPNATGEMVELTVSPVSTFPQHALEKAALENPLPALVEFELLFNGSLMELHRLMRSFQKKLLREHKLRYSNEPFSTEIAYSWQGIEEDTFCITLIDLRSEEPCGNVSAFSIPKGAGLEVWYLDNDYARAIWERLRREMEAKGFVDAEEVFAPVSIVTPSQPEPSSLKTARRALEILETQAAGFGALHIPAHLQIELEEKRREVAELEEKYRPALASAISPLSQPIRQAEILTSERPNISRELYQKLETTLLRCGPFRSDNALSPLFVDSRISQWRDLLPSRDNPKERVEAVMEKLSERHNAQGDNALVLLLRVIRDRTSTGDACHAQLDALADELAASLNAS